MAFLGFIGDIFKKVIANIITVVLIFGLIFLVGKYFIGHFI